MWMKGIELYAKGTPWIQERPERHCRSNESSQFQKKKEKQKALSNQFIVFVLDAKEETIRRVDKPLSVR